MPLYPDSGPTYSAAPSLIAPRQYLRIAFLTGVAMALLSLPGQLRQPGVTPLQVGLQFAQVLLFTDLMLALNYFLRYSTTSRQRWLRRQPQPLNLAIRVGLNLLLAAALGTLLRFLLGWLGYNQESGSWRITLLSSLLFVVIILAVDYFIEVNERSRHLTQENEYLKREQLQARYESLKQQLSPHFLFNSLSTLRWLIHDNPNAAERFVEEMSQVYRYLLQYGAQDAVPLRDEIAFLRSYMYLLQMRFGERLQLAIELPDAVLSRLVPPLALQTLIENAVKHNAVSRQYPLRIQVGLGKPDCLWIRNSRRPRITQEPSSGIGLRNLANRVRMLHQATLLVEEDPVEFRVCLPLPESSLPSGQHQTTQLAP